MIEELKKEKHIRHGKRDSIAFVVSFKGVFLEGMEVVMTPELERLLDEGLENLEQSKTTDELRRRS